MDLWKLIRLWLWIAAIVAFLATGTFARLVWGVPESPYGDSYWRGMKVGPRRVNPFVELRRAYSTPWSVHFWDADDPR